MKSRSVPLLFLFTIEILEIRRGKGNETKKEGTALIDPQLTLAEIIDPRSGSEDLGRRCASHDGGRVYPRRVSQREQKGTETDGHGRRENGQRTTSPAWLDEIFG